jgi:hypothetical protein
VPKDAAHPKVLSDFFLNVKYLIFFKVMADLGKNVF